ncbi:6-phosphogluconate dehydrogenase, decarboxylating [Cyphellophora attinorum]|uniref:6-phosphogluconate dehydrogenase, decarboxylating n=1 Tax=Cyphellophora attinorum TaxID=1664694 RepID=A0A0N0NJZ6_9EURO|nr:6-phosphogluconate dehydrogenase, decarboxylating [Phialophora attinorum]KPI37561.1 6-phosphogluconate dehydrogenase, decarboxylating [Phialophora attinorum]
MGGMMSLLYAEHGVDVHFFDPSEENVHQLLHMAKKLKTDHKIVHEKDYEQLCKSISVPSQPRLFVFSIPHGTVGDKTVDSLMPYLQKGDVILDCSNELWQNTERRQSKLDPKGIHYVGCGVSGGYQSARHGPSMSPGGTPEALDKVMPFLRRVAAKDKQGRPCTTPIGPGGSGHYVKMIHNGIEQGMMSALAEAWSLMTTHLGMTYEEVANTFEEWNDTDPLRDNFLISIGVEINRTKDPDAPSKYLLASIRDKVVQDVNEEEGTGTWSCWQAIDLHIPAPTIVAAHLFRLASADATQRAAVSEAFTQTSTYLPTASKIDPTDRTAFLSDLQQALYASFLTSFAQGLHIIHAAATANSWPLDFAAIIGIWRGGCIIQSDYISDLFTSIFTSSTNPFASPSSPKNSTPTPTPSLLTHPLLVKPLAQAYPSLKRVIAASVEADAIVPSLSATLEYLKYSKSTEMPTQFMEAQLDFFGGHMYELKSDRLRPGAEKGARHFEWRPARGILDG